MRTQWVAFRDARMIEIESLQMLHSDFLHHAAGAKIVWHGNGHNFQEL